VGSGRGWGKANTVLLIEVVLAVRSGANTVLLIEVVLAVR
jgi:hypothetical protein